MILRKKQRLMLVLLALLLVGAASGLILTALDDKVAFFVSPSDIATKDIQSGRQFRLGGLVVEGSILHEQDGLVRFEVTDTAHEVPVTYKGILPDLFREGQGVVAEGSSTPTASFVASEVLAKHDENYMPPEVADALKSAGHWQDKEGAEAP